MLVKIMLNFGKEGHVSANVGLLILQNRRRQTQS